MFFGVTGFVFADHGEHMKKMMGKMDTNNDGQVSKEEWIKHHEEMFTKLDADGDGNITKEEFKAFKKAMKDKKEDKDGEKKDKKKKDKKKKDKDED